MRTSVTDEQLEERFQSLDPEDVINIQYTSGTTGFPKGVMLTHNNVVNNGKLIGDYMKLTEQDRVCIPVPFFHCFGCVLGTLAAVTHGSAMILLEQFDPFASFRRFRMKNVQHFTVYQRCSSRS